MQQSPNRNRMALLLNSAFERPEIKKRYLFLGNMQGACARKRLQNYKTNYMDTYTLSDTCRANDRSVWANCRNSSANRYTTFMPQETFQVAPVTLEGKLVRLEPLSMDHLPALFEAAQDERIWQWWTDPMKTEDDIQRYIQSGLDAAAAGTAMPWATRSKRDDRIIGATRFADIHLRNRTLEIGWTWMHPDYQRSGINVEAKYLQLRHAFEVMGARRVAFKTHHNNLKSQTAIQALGAKPEGVFRNHYIMPDGSARHSHWFSIIVEEWPEVKANLEGRMQRNSATFA